MVAIVTGNGLGLVGSSAAQLGGAGLLGNANQGSGTAGGQITINAANGNLILQRTDEFLRSLGPDAGILRTYNSQGLLNDDNADNWRLGFSRRVLGLTGTVNTAGSTITRIDEDGAEVLYVFDTTSGKYISNTGPGAADSLSFNGSSWVWRDGSSQTTEQYASHTAGGHLQSVTDRNGNTITLSYTNDLVTRIETSSGERIDIVYDTASGKTSNILEIRTQVKVNGTGPYVPQTSVRYAYDTQNRLTSVSVDITPADNSIADGNTYVTSYTYDGNSNRIATITQTDGSEVRFTYDASFRVTSVSEVRSATDISVTTFDYSVANQTTVTDALGNVTVLAYDSASQLTGVTHADGSTASYTYDARGNVVSSTDGRGKSTVYQYDANNNHTYLRDAAGNVTQWTYNANNDVLTETLYRVADPDGAGVQLPSQPIVTRYVYDTQGNLRFHVSADGRVTELRYDANGQEVSRVSYMGALYGTASASTLAALTTWSTGQSLAQTQRIDTTYDFRGEVKTRTTYAKVGNDGIGVRDGTQSETWYIYDQAGRLLQTIDPRGVATTGVANDYVTTYAYDGLGRLLTTVRTDQNGHSLTVVSNSYNDTARLVTSTLVNGLVSTTTYDKSGRAISVVQRDSNAASQQVGRTDYAYDKLGRVVAERITTQTGSISSSYTVYDSVGRKSATIDATGALIEYIYNNNDQVIRSTAYNTLVTASKLANDPTTFTLVDLRPGGSGNRTNRWLYDNAGRLSRVIDGENTVTEYQYDGAGQLVRSIAYASGLSTAQKNAIAALGDTEIDATNPNTKPSNNAADRITRSFYSDDGLLLATLDGEGYLSENLYDASGQLIQTIRYTTVTPSAQRANGTLASLRPATNASDLVSHVVYNARGQDRKSVV